MHHSTLQESSVFFEDVKQLIRKAKKRIWVQVMIFEMVPAMEEYVALFMDAARRGVDVQLGFDWISERYYGENLDVYPTINHKKIKTRQAVHLFAQEQYTKLRKSGVTLTIFNLPSSLGGMFLLGKRNHNKLIIIDDIAWTGGINLIANPNRFIDFMVKIYDPRIVSVIECYFSRLKKVSEVISCTDEYQFLIDEGKKGSSLIYRTAIELIQNAKKEITFVSQMLPDSGFLEQLVKKSKQGVHINAIISSAEHNIFTKFPFRYHYQLFQSKIKNNSHFTLLHSKQWIHAKLLVIDREKAIFGSHNFAKWNELIGIEETGFLTSDKNLLTQFNKFSQSIKI
ncbi:MAG TPA: phosphatidylserine/phosphatidylglycerophosphate/cardiolipin synthase family protein [Candidatus Saccharimonadales bacterium]|nr:phosphatidylserine/phosphatidylglycerophosphate/cardiolipin synthase family protein [Candidatus Saccharimonadales bacterium]